MEKFVIAMRLLALLPGPVAAGLAGLILGMPLALLWTAFAGGNHVWLYVPPLFAWVMLWAEVGTCGLLRLDGIWRGLGWGYLTAAIAAAPVIFVVVKFVIL